MNEAISPGCRVAVMIPCYNESVTISKVVTDFRKSLPEADIYVYDNNSTDGTGDIARKAGAIVRREHRQGKGNVMRSMFSDIDADVYIIVDGDDTYCADAAPRLVSLISEGKADMVVADRLSSTYFTENKRAFHNSGNRLVRSLINRIFNARLHDILSGYRAFSRDFIKNFPVMSKGFEIETEMTIHALDKNYKVCEIPVEYRDRPADSESKLNTFSDGFRVIGTILVLFKSYRPFLFFSILALLSLCGSLILTVPVIMEYWDTGLVPRFPSLIVGCTLLMLGILLFLCGLILSTISNNQRQLFELIRLQSKSREERVERRE